MISRFLPSPLRRFLGVKVSTRPPSYLLLDQPGSLAPLLTALERVHEVALDTEADNMYHYRTRVCLLQFLVGREVFLVDVLAPGLKLDSLWKALSRKHLIMHGSDFDLRLLHDLCRFQPHSLFDTMLAAQLLGRKRIGLASLLEDHFGVALDKDGQKANWSKRPITSKLLNYAALDVWHLPALRDILTRELKKLGRLSWLEQQCQAQIASGAEGFAPATDNDWRIGRSERLRGAGLSVLHAIWHWRESQAQRLDTPPFKVCGNALLLKIAEAAEGGASEASILAEIHLGKRHERLFPSLSAAIRAGLARDPKSLPRRPGRDPNHISLTQAQVELQDRIRADRDRVAGKLAIEATLIANRAQLSQIARNPRKLGDCLLPWQAELLRHEPSLKSAP
ncbi:MAG: HRDC domain-containing protein [Verrucomicrobia bacterium]|nr:HRDC domain-containing protein [Verrucomicrobiota bacterium]